MKMKGRPILEATKKKIGEANRGRKRPDLQAKWSQYLITKDPTDAPVPFRKSVLVEYRCAQCGTRWQGKQNGYKMVQQRHFCSKECRSIWRMKRYAGANNPGYIHGQAERPYPLSYRKMRTAIKERDGYLCQRCGREEAQASFHIHHKDFDKRNTDADNLITLCPSCHAHVTSKRILGWSALIQGDLNGTAN